MTTTPAETLIPTAARNALLQAWTRKEEVKRDVAAHSHAHGQMLGSFRGLISVSTETGQSIVPSVHSIWIPPHHVHAMQSHGAFSGWGVFILESACCTLPAQPCTMATSGLLREAVIRAATWCGDSLDDAQKAIAMVIIDEIRSLPRQRLGLPMPTDRRLLQITRAIAENPANTRRLEDWAAAVGFSTRTLSRRFTIETGFSFTEWRQRARLMRALEMLAIDTSVTAVALSLGYETVSAFIAMFRRVFGVTPTGYFEEATDHGPIHRRFTKSPSRRRTHLASIQICK